MNVEPGREYMERSASNQRYMYRHQALTAAARVKVITSSVFIAPDSLSRESSFVMR